MSEEPVETVERLSAEAVSEAVEATDEKAAEEKPPAIQAEEGAIEDGEAGEMAGEQAGGRSSLKKDGTPRRSSARASVVIVSQEVLPTGEDKEISEEGQLEQGEAEAVQKTVALGKMDSMEAFMGEQEGEEYGEMIDVEPMDKRILLVGNCVMDYVLICDRYPAEDSDRRALDGYWQRGGNASNNATVLRQLNAPVEFFGVLSQSDAFSCLLEDCYNRGIIIDHCPRVPAHPPFSSVMLSEATGTRTIVHCNQNFPYVSFEQFKSLGDLRQYMWVHFEARNVPETMNMMKMLWSHNERHEHKIQISLDLEVVSKETLKLAPYADINILGKDLARFMGWNDPVKACKGFRTHIQSAEEELGHRSLIVVPWSEQGAVCMDYENNVHTMPAYPPPVIHDTLGAGDTFTGALIHALCVQEMFLREAVDFANRVAGYKCGHRGYDAISKMPVDQFKVRADDEEDF